MILELFKIFIGTGPLNEDGKEDWIGSVDCFSIDGKFYTRHKHADFIENKWKYLKCSLDRYKKFEIEQEPKNFNSFSWLIIHHFNALTSSIANQADINNKIQTFLNED